jgi:hypothetical protein
MAPSPVEGGTVMKLREMLRSLFGPSARKRAFAVALVPVRSSQRVHASRRERAVRER